MCLGVPGQIIVITDGKQMMALADISGVRREINVACIARSPLEELVGQWVLIHVGFAMAVIDEAEAQRCLAALQALGQALGQAQGQEQE